MPARSNADGDELRLTASSPDQDGSLTVMVWAVMRSSSVSEFGCIVSLSDSSSRFWFIQEITSGSDVMVMRMKVGAGDTSIVGPDLTGEQDIWFCYAMRYDQTDVDYRTRRFDAATFTDHGSDTPTNSDLVISHVLLGETPSGGEWWDGSFDNLKVWEALLTDDEIENESRFYVPQRTANLFMWNPLLVGDEWQDMSGNGRDLVEAGTMVADQDGPPIPWAPARHRLLLPPAGVTVQTLRPDSDIAVGGWTPTPSSPTTLFDKIDEVTASDTDYISET